MLQDKLLYTAVIGLLAVGSILLGLFDKERGGGLFQAGNRFQAQNMPKPDELREKLRESFKSGKAAAWYYRRQINREIYEGLSMLRNMSISQTAEHLSAEYVLMCLSGRNGILQESYRTMLSLLRRNKPEEAEKRLAEVCGSGIGAEYAGILAGWDMTEPGDMQEILISYQKSLREMNATVQRRREELISDLIYFPTVLNVFVIFINFIYIGYFLEQKALLNMIL